VKKLLIASLKEIISLGLAEPEEKYLFRDSREKFISFNICILLALGLELK
tara:strand:+ start:346 stop:495 length:150 start_codon:yes stop_codon:yes gene_type:complete